MQGATMSVVRVMVFPIGFNPRTLCKVRPQDFVLYLAFSLNQTQFLPMLTITLPFLFGKFSATVTKVCMSTYVSHICVYGRIPV